MLSKIGLRKVAIVTGAASGIGRSIALRLARDGYNIVISDLETQSKKMEEVAHHSKQINSAGEFLRLTCDVSKEDQVEELVKGTVAEFGRLDCMVANAGIAKFELLSDVTGEGFSQMLAVNVLGVLFCYRTAAKAMIECKTANGGRIIGACSQAAKKGFPMLGAYCATKSAVRSLTQTSAIEYGTTGITVNAYAPSFLDTPLVTDGAQYLKERYGINPKELVKETIGQSALKRMGTLEEVSNLVSFLASEQSSLITGQCISIDGGHYMD